MDGFKLSFLAWLGRVCATEKPASSVIAFNIGLFETPDGYSAYLVGADSYSAPDNDWACNETFTPKERYFPLPAEGFKGKSWAIAQDAVVRVAKTFLRSPAGASSFLATAQAVTVGFDDGELTRIR